MVDVKIILGTIWSLYLLGTAWLVARECSGKLRDVFGTFCFCLNMGFIGALMWKGLLHA